MIQSNQKTTSDKPQKPYPDFPLYAHGNGHWAKKIRGRVRYLGRWEDPDGALQKYLDQKEDLYRGLEPRNTRELTIELLCLEFLKSRKRLLNEGELSPYSYAEYASLCKRLMKVFGNDRLVRDLRPDDFDRLRGIMSRTWGPVTMKAEIVRTRTPFNWAYKNGMLDRPIVFGEGFKVPSKKTIRKHKAEQGLKMFEADEIRAMLDAAGLPLRAMILLGVNCGYGNNDVAKLTIGALDLGRGWVSSARPKTGIQRRCPLWPETVEAIKGWLTIRPEPKNDEHKDRIFITRWRSAWDNMNDRAVTKEVRKLLDKLKINGHRNFYCLRHTLQTIGDEARDSLAVRHIMGHAGTDIADEYRERISDERLHAVADHVRRWLFPKDDAGDDVLPFRRNA